MYEFLSFQQRKILNEQALDLILWNEKSMEELWAEESKKYDKEIKCKRDASIVYNNVLKRINTIRETPTDYSTFNPNALSIPNTHSGTSIIELIDAPNVIMGHCPGPSKDEVLRCCNLVTLDAVQQCGYGCAYCSIQSFYHEGKIRVIKNLREKMFSEDFNKALRDNNVWHLGTGQSSDSLMLGNEYETISILSDFCLAHNDIIVELKTKSDRTDWINSCTVYNGNESAGLRTYPKNLVPTWSLNASTIVEKEEHKTARLIDRIKAAEKVQKAGFFVGFHIHPMVYFKGYEKEYKELTDMLTDHIDPERVLMVSIGTLTFTKAVLKTLRNSKVRTRVTCMPLAQIAGKYSYPLSIKKEMFSYMYSLFPKTWKENIFFYLCMEDATLWEPCLGRSYKSNSEYEADMKAHYFSKIQNS